MATIATFWGHFVGPRKKLLTLQRLAREQGKGLWAKGLAAPAKTSPQPVSSSVGMIRGNKNRHIYHLPTCPTYDVISPMNVVTFATEEEARRAGYRKAKNCP